LAEKLASTDGCYMIAKKRSPDTGFPALLRRKHAGGFAAKQGAG